jgi:hypothetical protein
MTGHNIQLSAYKNERLIFFSTKQYFAAGISKEESLTFMNKHFCSAIIFFLCEFVW